MRMLSLLLLALAVPSALAQKAPPKPSAVHAAPTVLGTWDYLIVMPDREPRGTLTVERAAAGYKGSITTDSERRFETVEVHGGALRATFEQPGFGAVELAAVVGPDGTLAGTVATSAGAFPVTATRAETAGTEAARPEAPLRADALAGRWRYELEAPDGSRPFGTLVFEQSGGRLKGRVIGFSEEPLETIHLGADRVVLSFTPSGFSRFTIEATVDGDTMTGSFSGIDPETDQPVSLPLTASRTDG